MFESFFPKPKAFFISAILWSIVAVIFWFNGGAALGETLGFQFPAEDAAPIVGLRYFITPDFLWFYIYYWVFAFAFYAFWRIYSPHPWENWSILGSALIIFVAYYSVQVSVVLSYWSRGFFDLIQVAVDPNGREVTQSELLGGIGSFLAIAMVYVFIATMNIFFVSHWVFRWRQAMNDFYVERWGRLRHIEGASQRIQEDTMRFASIMKKLGIAIIDSVMTLIAFTPLLMELSKEVNNLPILGSMPNGLLIAAIAWAILGSVLMFVVGAKLPGLEFKNQRVEAAFRKELVYGEDDENRADPPTLSQLFKNVRRNYFRLYLHYTYFNMFRTFYLQLDNVFVVWLLVPLFAAKAITFGIYQQVSRVFSQVSDGFQFLVASWPDIIELLSIHKRLRAFEVAIDGKPLPKIDEEYLKEHGSA